MSIALAYWLAVANIIAFMLMMIDKAAARQNGRRIAERSLIGWSMVGGSAGALLASLLIRHKTRKQPIAFVLRATLAVHLFIAIIWTLASLPSVS